MPVVKTVRQKVIMVPSQTVFFYLFYISMCIRPEDYTEPKKDVL